MYIELEILGKPKGKSRARRAENGQFYIPKATKTREAEIRTAYTQRYGALKAPKDTAVSVGVTAFFHKKSTDQTDQPLRTPDIDNIAKLVLDALNGTAWDDDRQVWRITAERRYTLGNSVTYVNITWKEPYYTTPADSL